MKPTQPQPKEQAAIIQAGYYAAEMFTAHTARLHVFGLIIVGDVLYFWRYDHQGNIQCSGFNFIQDLPRFLIPLLAMHRFRESHWGLHPKIDPEFGPRLPSHRPALTGDEGEEIDVTLELSDKERVSHYGLNSRATNLFSIKSDKLSTEGGLVVEVLWAEATHTREPDILKRVYEIAHDKDIEGHVPVMLWYKSFRDTSTAKVRNRLGLETEGARVLYTTIFRNLRPITELTGRDFLLVWWETVKCHLALWKNDVYHRDISASNLMYCTVNGKIVGVLNDFDLASTEKTATGTERTGTIPFMALDLLEDDALEGHVSHAYKHDAELFIWVMIWICLRYDDGKPREHGRPLDAWLKVDAVGCREKKSNFLGGKARRNLVAGKSHEENWKLATAYINALVMINTTISISPEDPYVHIDDAFKAYLSDVIRLFLEIPADGPREETSEVVTSSLASEAEWELVSTVYSSRQYR